MNFHWLSLKSTYNFQTVIIISQPPDFGRACQMQSFWPKQKAGGKLCRKLNPWMTLRLITKRPGVWICRNRILNKRFPYMTASKNEALSVITSWRADWAGTAFGKSSAVYGHIDKNEGFVRKSSAQKMPFTDKSSKMRALSVNLNEVLPQIIVMHHCIYQKRPARSSSLFA